MERLYPDIGNWSHTYSYGYEVLRCLAKKPPKHFYWLVYGACVICDLPEDISAEYIGWIEKNVKYGFYIDWLCLGEGSLGLYAKCYIIFPDQTEAILHKLVWG
jgi:hypothetical protein